MLSWRVVSADGHPVGGVVSFSRSGTDELASLAPRADRRGAVHAAIWAVRNLFWLSDCSSAPAAPAFVAWLAASVRYLRDKAFRRLMIVRHLAAAQLRCRCRALTRWQSRSRDAFQPSVWVQRALQPRGALTAILALAALVAASLCACASKIRVCCEGAERSSRLPKSVLPLLTQRPCQHDGAAAF